MAAKAKKKDKPLQRRATQVAVIAKPKCGKTLFGLNDVPRPIDLHNFDQNVNWCEEVVDGFPSPFDDPSSSKHSIRVLGVPQAKGIYPCYPLPFDANDGDLDENRAEALPIWLESNRLMSESLRNDCRTILIDEWVGWSDLGRCAIIGVARKTDGDEDPFQKNWGKLKKQLRAFCTAARMSGKQVIYLARGTHTWVDGEPSSDPAIYEQDGGWKGLQFEVPIVLQLERTEWKGHPRFSARVNASSYNQEATLGMTFKDTDDVKEVRYRNIVSAITGWDEKVIQ